MHEDEPKTVPGFLVVGPESSGSTAVTELLLSAGAQREPEPRSGYPEHFLAFEAFDGTKPLVIHRSFPYDGTWPEVREVFELIRSLGATPELAIVCLRSFDAMERSQVRRYYATAVEHAEVRILLAYQRIFDALAESAVRVDGVSVDGLVHHPEARKRLLERCGLTDTGFDLFDADARWFD